MSQKNDDILKDEAECLIDTNAITRRNQTTKVHRIKWTIENVSRLPLDTRVIGPDFLITKTVLCNISFKKTSSYLYIYLQNKSVENITMACSLILLNCEGMVLHQDKMETSFTLGTNQEKDVISSVSQRSRFDSLKNDILIIKCCLKTAGCITTEISICKSERESLKHLMNDLKSTVNNPVDSDFTLQVGNNIIHSHKNFLRARSSYFKRMFETDMKESAYNSVSITDVSHPIMLKVVEFLYSGDLTGTLEDNNIHEIFDLYFAADKYEVMDLRDLCSDKLASITTTENICKILQLAERHHDEDLKSWAMNFISFHFNEIETSDAWKTFLSTELVLASEVLSFCFKRLRLVP